MNILVIFSDQQHKYALGKRDDKFITPNLDKLCEEGILFQNGYSNNPVCGPYRGCLMSGQFTSRAGSPITATRYPRTYFPLHRHYGIMDIKPVLSGNGTWARKAIAVSLSASGADLSILSVISAITALIRTLLIITMCFL